MTRATGGQETMAMATTMEPMLGEKIATSTIGEHEARHGLEEFGEAHDRIVDHARRHSRRPRPA